MITREEMENNFIKELVRTPWPEYPKGGQSCGMPIRGVKLVHVDLGFEIAVGFERSQIKNLEIALDLFRLYISTVIKY